MNRVDAAVVVRRCTDADVEVMEAFEPAGQGYVRATFAAQQRGRCALLVAWLGSEPVGSGELEWLDSPELKNLHVRSEHRGCGIGTAIVRFAEGETDNGSRLRLGVAVDNPEARRLYERLGYRATGETETVTYEFIDVDGVTKSATETSEYLAKTILR